MGLKFPKNFFWGTATSAHQVEGNNKNNDWWRAEQKGEVPHKSGRACNSYNLYEEDFDLAKELGTNAHRFSIEWSRIEPREGEFSGEEIVHYKKIITALRERGLEPFVTLHHFTNPVWFADKGGWLNKKAPFDFARYAEHVVKNFPEIRFWVTVNEPLVVSTTSHLDGSWPPFQKSFIKYLRSKRTFTKAHIAAYKKIKLHDPELLVGVAKNNQYYETYNALSWSIAKSFERHWNLSFLNKIKKYQDFIGINYYRHNRIRIGFSDPESWLHNNENKEVSDLGWEIYPKGMYYVVNQVWQKYKKPIFIFENGVADADDDKRADFIKDHLKWLHKAISAGADVRGYFHWSLLDNFEWAEGYDMKFGLVEVDFETFERKPRKSFYVYKKICEANRLIN